MSITLAHDPMTSEAAARAIGAVRMAFHGTMACGLSAARRVTTWERDLTMVSSLFRTAQTAMMALPGGRGLIVGAPGAVTTTHHEQRLLQATTAAQDEEDELVDTLLCGLTPHAQTRPALTRAVTALANSLAGCGHWLSAPPLPAPALRIMRLRGIDPASLNVSWPTSGGKGARWAGDLRCGASS